MLPGRARCTVGPERCSGEATLADPWGPLELRNGRCVFGGSPTHPHKSATQQGLECQDNRPDPSPGPGGGTFTVYGHLAEEKHYSAKNLISAHVEVWQLKRFPAGEASGDKEGEDVRGGQVAVQSDRRHTGGGDVEIVGKCATEQKCTKIVGKYLPPCAQN